MTTKAPITELTEKFINGLKKYNLTYEDIVSNKWKYCGGRKGRHQNYFHLCHGKDRAFPELQNECVCGHHIKENCFITDGKQMLVLGNCCIKKFVPKSARSCEVCGKPHKNRKVNKCNDCRAGTCYKCSEGCNPSYKYCFSCTFSK
jgi:hypothetical protein